MQETRNSSPPGESDATFPAVKNFLQTTGMSVSRILLIALFVISDLSAAEQGKAEGSGSAKISVQITEPGANAEIHASRIDVRGKVESNVPIKRVFAQFNLAMVSKKDFVVRNVVLTPGTNVITVAAEDENGTQVTNSVTVIAKGENNTLPDVVRLRSSTSVGFSPLEVELSVETDLREPIEKVIWDFDGDGVPEFEAETLKPIKRSYKAGDYAPVVTLRTKNCEYSSVGGFHLSPWLLTKDMTTVHVEEFPKQIAHIAVSDPVDIEVHTNGHVFVLSRSTATLTEFDTNGKVVRSLDKLGTAPHGFTMDPHQNIYVALTGDHQVMKLKPTEKSFEPDPSFGKSGKIGNEDKTAGGGKEQFNKPYDIVLNWHSTVIYVSDSHNHSIQTFKQDGTFLGSTDFSVQLGEKIRPRGLARNSSGLVAVDADQNRLLNIFTSGDDERWSEGLVNEMFGKKGSLPGQFDTPLNVGSRWGGDAVYIADTGNDRIQKLDRERGIPIWAISKELGLKRPEAVCVPENLLEERLYIADTGNNRVIIAHIPQADPALVWKQMLDALIKEKNQEKALSYFTTEAAESYRNTIRQMGLDEFIQAMKKTETIEPVEIEDNTAVYRFDMKIEGHTLDIPIHFYKERGQWRIQEF